MKKAKTLKSIIKKPKLITIPESQIENAILEFLNYSGWYARKIPLAGYFDPKTRRYRKHNSPWIATGFSDIIAIKKTRILFLEVKSRIGKQSDDQKEFERNINFHGFNYHVVRSVEEVRAIINCAKQERLDAMKINMESYQDCHGN